MGKRQEAALKTRQSIIDAVKKLSETKRFDEMSIDDITAAAGVAKGTFYVYFKRREDIVAEIAYEKYGVLSDDILSQKITALEKLRIFLERSIDIIEGSTLEITQQWFRAVVAPSDGYTLGLRKMNFDIDFIGECLEEGLSTGEFLDIDVELTARQIVAEYYGLVIFWCMTDGQSNLKETMADFAAEKLPQILNGR